MTKLDEKQPIGKSPTKMEQISRAVNDTGVSRKQVEAVLESFTGYMGECLQKGLEFSFMGLVKFYTAEKPFTPERKGPNPFTGEMTTFPAKPAHKVVRAKLLKKLKEMVQ